MNNQSGHCRSTAHFHAMLLQSIPRGMSAEIMEGWSNNPRALQDALCRVLMPQAHKQFPVWTALPIKVQYAHGKHLHNVLRTQDDVLIDGNAQTLFASPNLCPVGKIETIFLAKVTAGQLGFKEKTYIGDILERAQSLGLQLCPPETAAILRMERRLDDSTLFYIGMEPVLCDRGDRDEIMIFVLEGSQWLRTATVHYVYDGKGNPEPRHKFGCSPDSDFIFALPQ